MCIENRRGRHHLELSEYDCKRIFDWRRRHTVEKLDFTGGFIPSGRSDVDSILRRWESMYSSYQTSSVFITTFNVNGRAPLLDGFPGWLTCSGILPPDFYIIGLQELSMPGQAYMTNISARRMEWKVAIAKSFPENTNYILIKEVQLGGLLLLIYRRVDSKFNICSSEIEAVVVPTGWQATFATNLSDKGGAAASLHMDDTTFCFVNAHFAANLNGNEKRIANYRHIVKSARFVKSGKSIFDHDVVFWFGDLNFRLEIPSCLSNDELRMLCSDDSAFKDMIVYDQLKRAMKLEIVFENFKEPEILDFRPTYKYDINSDSWDSSAKQRLPAWCDRILWWNRRGVRIRQKIYDSVPSIKLSDHRPVRALFYVAVRKVHVTEYTKAYQKAVKEADRHLNECNEKDEESEE